MSSRLTRASVREARARRGSHPSRSLSDARRAGLISRVAISSANRSSASSMATASRWRAIASSVAVRRGSASPSNVGALLASPYRASNAIRLAGTAEQSTLRTPRPASSAARSNALTRPGPDTRVGDRRHCSNSDHRDPVRHPQRRAQPPRQHRIRLVGSCREHAVHAVGGGLPHRVDQPGQHADPGQQHPVAAQPSHALLEQRRRSLGVRPRPAVQEPAELRGDRSLVEHPEPVGVPDLPRVLVGGLRALRVALRTRRIGHAQLLGQVLHHRPRHRQRILQEHAQITHGRGLQHEPEPVVIAAPITYPLLVGVVEQEEPLQVGPRRHAVKAAIGSDLRIRQEIQRHAVRRPPASRTPGPDRPNRCPTCEPDTPRPRSSLPPTAVRILLDPPLGPVAGNLCRTMIECPETQTPATFAVAAAGGAGHHPST